MDDVKPPAPPVGSDTPARAPAAAAPPKLSPRQLARKAEQDRLAELAANEEERQKFHAELETHLAEANHPERNTTDPPHPQVQEHARLRGFHPIQVLDPTTMTWVERPCWQMQALVARFHMHGLRHDAQISHEHFEAALHEALQGRV